MTEKETAREPRRVAGPKEEKETKGKEKVKERKGYISTKSQNPQKSSGQVDLGNNFQIILEDGILRSEQSHLVSTPLDAKLFFLSITLLHVEYLIHNEKSDLVHIGWNGKANGHRAEKFLLFLF